MVKGQGFLVLENAAVGGRKYTARVDALLARAGIVQRVHGKGGRGVGEVGATGSSLTTLPQVSRAWASKPPLHVEVRD